LDSYLPLIYFWGGKKGLSSFYVFVSISCWNIYVTVKSMLYNRLAMDYVLYGYNFYLINKTKILY